MALVYLQVFKVILIAPLQNHQALRLLTTDPGLSIIMLYKSVEICMVS